MNARRFLADHASEPRILTQLFVLQDASGERPALARMSRKGLEMHRVLMAAVLMISALSLQGVAAQQAQQMVADEGMKATGIVTEVDTDTHQIAIGDQVFIMPKEGGGMPQVGAEITVYYEEKDGQKTITRIGQAQQ